MLLLRFLLPPKSTQSSSSAASGLYKRQSFNHWQQQCDLSLGQLSRLIAYATGDNHVHLEEVANA
mgnify:CR=1 FL=1